MTRRDVVSSLQKYIGDNFSTTDVKWAGVPLETGDLDDYVEVHVIGFDKPPQRIYDKEVTAIELQVSVFARKSKGLYGLYAIADALHTLLNHKCITVKDYTTGGTPTRGYLKLEEVQIPTIADDPVDVQMRHGVLTVRGNAEAI